jgi:hypothetical protein
VKEQIEIERNLLEDLAKAKDKIQAIKLWIDDARTNWIARIRYKKNKENMKKLIKNYKGLFQDLKELKNWE